MYFCSKGVERRGIDCVEKLGLECCAVWRKRLGVLLARHGVLVTGCGIRLSRALAWGIRVSIRTNLLLMVAIVEALGFWGLREMDRVAEKRY